MARFNKIAPITKTKNLAGGKAYAQTSRQEFLSILFTSFLKDQFYRSADDTITRVKELISKEDKKFVAKAAIYARTKLGMRSISHLVASEIAKMVKGEQWSKSFFEKIIHRPDDMTEIAACYMNTYGKPMPNSMKKGFAKALEGLDAYKLAKYRMEGKDVSMVDLVNLVHPKNTEAIRKLVKGELKNTETWESKLSQAGQSDEDADVAKADAWGTLLKEGKLGYMALLKNLRNILEQAPECVDMACEQLVNVEAIRKSLVLPFRFTTAYNELEKINADGTRKVLIALSKATDLSMANVPSFPGKTLVVLDVSGSMTSVMEKAALFTSVLYKACDADLMLFAQDARYETLMPTDATLSIAKRLRDMANGGGTNFFSIWETMNRAYDRIVILSDMQGWMSSGGLARMVMPTATGLLTFQDVHMTMSAALQHYKSRTGANPHIFSFDMAGYGTLQLPENNVYCLAGFSDKILGMMKFLEEDKKAMEKEIESINL